MSNEHTILNTDTSLFDEFGRCTPQDLTAAAHQRTRRYFQLAPILRDDKASYERLNQAFAISEHLSLEEFSGRIDKLIANIVANDQLKAMLNGTWVPFVLPKAEYQDIGAAMEQTYLPAVEQAFSSKFPEYSFTNHAPKSLAGQLKAVKESRHTKLLSAMSDDVVVGIYFPALLEYSLPAAIEQIQKLPESCLLAGGYDTAAAFISQPDLLLRKDGYPPLLWLSGLEAAEENTGYHFEAYGYDLSFNRRVHFGHVAEYWASACVVLG